MSQTPGQESVRATDLQGVNSLELFSRCAQDTEDDALWTEFLRRFSPRIKEYIRRPLRLSGSATALHENDLFQSAILRLVDNSCACMKRFSGATEHELLAYLAIITGSVVRDCLRRQRALKRPAGRLLGMKPSHGLIADRFSNGAGTEATIERDLLAQEVRRLSLRTLENLTGEFSSRDKVIFRLYFFHGLSLGQIAQCRGVEISKQGVDKILQRLTGRVRSAVRSGPSEALTK